MWTWEALSRRSPAPKGHPGPRNVPTAGTLPESGYIVKGGGSARVGEEVGHGSARVSPDPRVGDVVGAVDRQVAPLAGRDQVGRVAALAALRIAAAAEMRNSQHHARAGSGVGLVVQRRAASAGGRVLARMIVTALAPALTETARAVADLTRDGWPLGRILRSIEGHGGPWISPAADQPEAEAVQDRADGLPTTHV